MKLKKERQAIKELNDNCLTKDEKEKDEDSGSDDSRWTKSEKNREKTMSDLVV